MIIGNDRTEFDKALKGATNDFLLLFGNESSLAKRVYDEAIQDAEDWNWPVLFQDLTQLSAAEKQDWFRSNDDYTLLSRFRKFGDSKRRDPVEQKPLTELCEEGAPSSRLIQGAFARADKA